MDFNKTCWDDGELASLNFRVDPDKGVEPAIVRDCQALVEVFALGTIIPVN